MPRSDPLPRWARAQGPAALVLGGGVAGLVAARDLERAGLRVTVLEATGKVGGRVRTLRDFSDGSHGEAGADLLEAGHTELHALAKELGLRRIRVIRKRFRFWIPSGESADMRWDHLVARMKPFGEALDRARRSWSSPAARRLARVSVEEWMRSAGLPEDERARWRGLVRGLYVGNPYTFSLLQLADEMSGGEEAGATGRFYRIRGGNDLLAEALEASLSVPVEKGVVVEQVERSARGVRVRAAVRGRKITFRADACVVALPVPPLRAVRFRPALPADQRRALRTVGFGAVTKTILRLRRGPRGPKGAGWGSDLPVGAFWDGGEGSSGRSPLLAVSTGGDLSVRLAHLSESARVRWVTRHQPLVPPASVLEGRSVVWENEPFAGGGYATFDVGFDPALRAALARPLPRLTFAGEHTSRRHQGYVEGAVESGHRAARELRAMLAAWRPERPSRVVE